MDNHVVLAPGGPFPMPSPGYLAAGGAILVQNADLNLTDSQLFGNTAYVALNSTNANGGAVYVTGGVHTISNNEFTANASLHLPTGVQVCQGGAIYASTASLLLSENTFTENLTHGSGGALTLAGGTHTMFANRFTANEAIGLGGALSCSGTTLDAFNNIFALNTANNNGGAIHSSFNQGSNRYVNNTFYANAATVEGGAIYLDGREDHILNNIFWLNTANGAVQGAHVRFYNSSNSTMYHNLWQSDTDANGNIAATDPQFADAASGDFALLSSSPCINSGDNAHYLSTYDAADFAGNPRIFNEIIDMGAYELQSASTVSATHAAGKALPEVYPNPVASGGMLHFVTGKSDVLQVFDLTGKGCYERRLNPGVNQVQVELRPGLYLARLQDGTAIKLVVQ